MSSHKLCVLSGVLALSLSALACDSCGCSIGDPARGGGSGITAGIGDLRRQIKDLIPDTKTTDAPEPQLSNGNVPDFTKPPPLEEGPAKPHRWSVDTTFEFREFQHNRAENSFIIVQSGHDQHAYRFDYSFGEHIGYLVNDDLSVGISAGFRDLHKLDVDVPNRIGQRENSSGPTDPVLDAKFRFMRQSECFPLDMAVFGVVKTDLGLVNNRRPTGELFETEDQPGTGSWNETLGLAVSHGWEKWGVSSSASYTHKGEGAERFKEGDITRLSLSASRLLTPECFTWKAYFSTGLQGLLERHAVDHGITDPDHGGRFMYVLPGIAVKPNDRLIVSVTAPIPVIQDENGTHQKQRWNLQVGVGVRF
ncbi:MAG TPA: hypothetical protein VKX17_03320 [Planctomycetota bacterium]|nr:hypothetical protein [Planctomycetota bacterium]